MTSANNQVTLISIALSITVLLIFKQMNIYKTLSISYYIGMIMLLTGILFQLNDLPYAYIFLIAGIIPLIGVRLFNYLKGKPENRRLHGIMVISALFLVAAAVAVFFNRSYWIIGILITATLDLYVSFRKHRG